MKYCQQCGSQLVDQAVVCPNCGCTVQEPINQQEDKPSTGLNVLAFLFPLIGLIMLMGVATKNSILLVEYAIEARREL